MTQEEHSKVLPSDPPTYEETAKKDEIMYKENYKHFTSYHEAITFITSRLQSKSRRLQVQNNEQHNLHHHHETFSGSTSN